MTKQQMRAEFFRAKDALREALVSRGLHHTDDRQFYVEIQNVWRKMNEITPKFK